MAHKGTIGNPPRGPGGAKGFSDLGEISVKPSPGRALCGNWYTQRVPGYFGKHSPRKKSWETSWGTDPPTKLCFSGPLFRPKKSPGPSRTQFWGWVLQEWGLSQKYQSWGMNNHAESTSQCPKRSHMLQVMAPNHFGVAAPILGGSTPSLWATTLPQGQPL